MKNNNIGKTSNVKGEGTIKLEEKHALYEQKQQKRFSFKQFLEYNNDLQSNSPLAVFIYAMLLTGTIVNIHNNSSSKNLLPLGKDPNQNIPTINHNQIEFFQESLEQISEEQFKNMVQPIFIEAAMMTEKNNQSLVKNLNTDKKEVFLRNLYEIAKQEDENSKNIFNTAIEKISNTLKSIFQTIDNFNLLPIANAQLIQQNNEEEVKKGFDQKFANEVEYVDFFKNFEKGVNAAKKAFPELEKFINSCLESVNFYPHHLRGGVSGNSEVLEEKFVMPPKSRNVDGKKNFTFDAIGVNTKEMLGKQPGVLLAHECYHVSGILSQVFVQFSIDIKEKPEYQIIFGEKIKHNLPKYLESLNGLQKIFKEIAERIPYDETYPESLRFKIKQELVNQNNKLIEGFGEYLKNNSDKNDSDEAKIKATEKFLEILARMNENMPTLIAISLEDQDKIAGLSQQINHAIEQTFAFSISLVRDIKNIMVKQDIKSYNEEVYDVKNIINPLEFRNAYQKQEKGNSTNNSTNQEEWNKNNNQEKGNSTNNSDNQENYKKIMAIASICAIMCFGLYQIYKCYSEKKPIKGEQGIPSGDIEIQELTKLQVDKDKDIVLQ